MNNNMTVDMEEAYPLVMDVLRAKLVPMLQSSPGIGKSALGYQIALDNELCLIDVRLSQADPTDLNGFPFIITDDKTVHAKLRAGYVPMNTFPIEGDELPINPLTGKPYKGWLILLDEFNSASRSVQAAAYKLVLDKMVGMHKLHPKVALMCAGNLVTDLAIVNPLSTAMQSRLCHLEIRVCHKVWGRWADKSNIDHRVKSFIKFKPALLHKFEPNHTDLTFPSPRTWDFISRIILPWKNVEIAKLPLLAGTVGQGAAREFFSYTKIFGEIPTIEQILQNPENCVFGPEPSMHYALSGLVAHNMNASNADTLMKFIARLGIDFQVVTLRAAIAKDMDIRKQASVKQWVIRNVQELL